MSGSHEISIACPFLKEGYATVFKLFVFVFVCAENTEKGRKTEKEETMGLHCPAGSNDRLRVTDQGPRTKDNSFALKLTNGLWEVLRWASLLILTGLTSGDADARRRMWVLQPYFVIRCSETSTLTGESTTAQ